MELVESTPEVRLRFDAEQVVLVHSHHEDPIDVLPDAERTSHYLDLHSWLVTIRGLAESHSKCICRFLDDCILKVPVTREEHRVLSAQAEPRLLLRSDLEPEEKDA